MIHLTDFLRATGGRLVGPPEAERFARFAFDSRLVVPGELFLAVRSERGDGHDYVVEACRKGASGVVAQRQIAGCDATYILVDDTLDALRRWGRFIVRQVEADIIGVTGSTGKTTTKEAVAHVLAAAGPTFRSPGNWNGRFGLPLALGELRPEHRFAVLEFASDSRGEVADMVAMAPPAVAIVTTVQPAHLDTFGDLDGVAEEKSDLVRALPEDGLALLNADDPRVAGMAAVAAERGAAVETYGTTDGAAWRAGAIQLSLEGTRFDLLPGRGSDVPLPFFVPLLGRHAVYPALAAIAAGRRADLSFETIRERLATMARVPGRLNPLPGRGGSTVLDDSYNASPAALDAALELLAALPARRRVALLGGMAELGEYSDEAHRAAGVRAAAVVDRLVTRGERGRTIALSAEAAGLDPAVIAVTYTTDDAVQAAREGLGEGDLLLVKGGMESRMERAVAALVEPAARAKLVRQDAAWQQIATFHLDRPTWIQVDLEAVAENTRRLKARLAPGVSLMAVMKADAYGHGAVKAAQTALNNGAAWIGVACLPEAEPLREAGISAPMLILGVTPPWQARAALRLDLRVTLFSFEVARALSRAAAALDREARVHIKVDTGMHRLGLFPEEVPAFIQKIQRLPHLVIEGLFTHFSVADGIDPFSRDYTERQLARFNTLLDALAVAGIGIPVVHAANSAAMLTRPESHFDMVRPGIALYGLAPSPDIMLPEGLRPALSWKTQIAQVKMLDAGAYVSYGATYRTEAPRRIAVIPVGYADGFRRAPRNWGSVLVRGQEAPLVGRVCMDQSMIDVSAIPGARAGDEVVLIGRQEGVELSAETVAARLGTIPYEVVAEILARVPRVD